MNVDNQLFNPCMGGLWKDIFAFMSPSVVPSCLQCVLFIILCIIVTARKEDVENKANPVCPYELGTFIINIASAVLRQTFAFCCFFF